MSLHFLFHFQKRQSIAANLYVTLITTAASGLNYDQSDKENALTAFFLELCKLKKVEGLTLLRPFLVKYSQKSHSIMCRTDTNVEMKRLPSD